MTIAVIRNGKGWIKNPDGSLSALKDQTDWGRVNSLTEEEIEANAYSDPDNLPMEPEEWEKYGVKVGFDKRKITIRLDDYVVQKYKKEGHRYQTRINNDLRKIIRLKSLLNSGENIDTATIRAVLNA